MLGFRHFMKNDTQGVFYNTLNGDRNKFEPLKLNISKIEMNKDPWEKF